MDDYPAYSLTQNIPLLVTIGLPAGNDDDHDDAAPWTQDAELWEQSTLLRSDLPALEGELAAAFRRYITAGDVSGPVPPGCRRWRGRASPQRYRFRIRTAGRTYYVPPRRARLPEAFDAPDPDLPPPVLHSPFSPLSPSCSLYPDGILDARWVQKHQQDVPSVFLCVYALSADAATATLHDSQIRADIAAFRTAVQQSGYRSRVAVAVFASDGPAPPPADGVVQERLEAIRKGSGVDSKLFFAVPAAASAGELHRVAENMLTTIYAPAAEYYRELARHVRKKRGRGSAPQPSVPPTSGTSQTLSLAGWHIRCDAKAAVLADFRQETDVARRLLDQAYEALLGPEVLFGDAVPHWSPRWNEARLLADTLAVRSLRTLLMDGRPSAAVRRWTAHRDRLRALLDARGRGTANYGWPAWEARWAVVMADLVDRVGLPPPGLHPQVGAALLLLPETSAGGTAAAGSGAGSLAVAANERIVPWECLHHRGYWLRLAAHHTAARRVLARAIPEDDRRPPDGAPASQVAQRAFAYDDYLCPPPHEEYEALGVVGAASAAAPVVAYLQAARAEFEQRGQAHAAAELALACGRELAAAQQWAAALDVLAPLWTGGDSGDGGDGGEDAGAAGDTVALGASGWFDVREELAWALRAAARAQRRADLLVAIGWELLDARYTPQASGAAYDVARLLSAGGAPEKKEGGGDDDNDEGTSPTTEPETIAYPRGAPPPSFLEAAFVFKNGEAKAGATASAQLVLRSHAQAQAPPVAWHELRLRFSGRAIKPIVLRHRPGKGVAGGTTHTYAVVPLEEEGQHDGNNGDNGDDGDDDDSTDAVGLCGTADLTLRPQATVALEMAIPLRTAGDVRAVSVDLVYRCASYQLQLAVPLPTGRRHPSTANAWYLPRAGGGRTTVPRADSQALRILPRPPKLTIRLLQPAVAGAAGHTPTEAATALVVPCYTNEPVVLALELVNGEDADASVKLDVVMEAAVPPAATATTPTGPPPKAVVGGGTPGFTLLVAGEEIDTAPPAASPSSSSSSASSSALRSVPLGRVAAGAAVALAVRAPPSASATVVDVVVRAVYHLVSDAATPITQHLAFQLSLSNPFEANYDLLPRLHPAPWPSVFDAAGLGAEEPEAKAKATAQGLAQRWALVTRYASFATEDLRVVGVDLAVTLPAAPRVVCQHSRSGDQDGDATASVIRPQTMEEAQFDLVVQKTSLDDRDPVHLDVSFVVRWQRLAAAAAAGAGDGAGDGAPPINTTVLPVPRLALFGTEPRVLAAVAYGAGGRTLTLTVAIENASSHFLTFGISMEPSSAFAFSGAKLTTVHVLPMSRRTTVYRLVPLVRGDGGEDGEDGEDGARTGTWIRPGLVVRDKYFQKVLRILPTEGLKMDKEGLLVWVPAEEEEEEEEEEEGGEGGEEGEEDEGEDEDETENHGQPSE